MSVELSPNNAARLALRVYDVNSGNTDALKNFLKTNLFLKDQNKGGDPSKFILQADIGGRILRAAKDGFGICAKGGGRQS